MYTFVCVCACMHSYMCTLSHKSLWYLLCIKNGKENWIFRKKFLRVFLEETFLFFLLFLLFFLFYKYNYFLLKGFNFSYFLIFYCFYLFFKVSFLCVLFVFLAFFLVFFFCLFLSFLSTFFLPNLLSRFCLAKDLGAILSVWKFWRKRAACCELCSPTWFWA